MIKEVTYQSENSEGGNTSELLKLAEKRPRDSIELEGDTKIKNVEVESPLPRVMNPLYGEP